METFQLYFELIGAVAFAISGAALGIRKGMDLFGVTMVGIHERSAREKLHDGAKGHVMGDEVTRKFLQSIKRCLTFSQVRWPPEDLRLLMG